MSNSNYNQQPQLDNSRYYVSNPPAYYDAEAQKQKRDWKETAKMAMYIGAIVLLALLLLGIVIGAIAMLFDDDRALGRALHKWRAPMGNGNALSTNGDGSRS